MSAFEKCRVCTNASTNSHKTPSSHYVSKPHLCTLLCKCRTPHAPLILGRTVVHGSGKHSGHHAKILLNIYKIHRYDSVCWSYEGVSLLVDLPVSAYLHSCLCKTGFHKSNKLHFTRLPTYQSGKVEVPHEQRACCVKLVAALISRRRLSRHSSSVYTQVVAAQLHVDGRDSRIRSMEGIVALEASCYR
jgi:hypothetical protein